MEGVGEECTCRGRILQLGGALHGQADGQALEHQAEAEVWRVYAQIHC